MKIYHHGLRNDLTEITSYEKLILGKCHGVMLSRRGKDDNHIIIDIITEDDGTWHYGQGNGFSSFWLPSFVSIMNEAMEWIEKNCDRDPSGFGWVFRS